ncbi:thioesterase II family protein [Streptomyces olindensis]|uniref:thioesterase II family protein n=1 Tax=Streptomyces olindensis TaxID=358823 RepID=UPI0036C55EC8
MNVLKEVSAGTARWFHRPAPRPSARVRLVCVPHAGAGAATFDRWAAGLPDEVEVVAVRLPGRETRMRERPFSAWAPLAEEFAEALEDRVPSPYVLFGHSMGAMLVYETLVRGVGRSPERVILSGCRAPDVPRALPAIHDLPSDRFVAELGRLAGTPPEVLGAPRLMAAFEPVLRADIRLAETWSRRRPSPVPVPLTVFWGTDDEVAPPQAVTAWRALAARGFTGHAVRGGHFFFREHAPEFLGLLRGELSRALPDGRDAA